MNSTSEPTVQPDKPKEQGVLCSKELLDALFGKFVDADSEARQIGSDILESSPDYKAAIRRAQDAWDKYEQAKNQSASNNQAHPTAAERKH